jgi:hypothetical protein
MNYYGLLGSTVNADGTAVLRVRLFTLGVSLRVGQQIDPKELPQGPKDSDVTDVTPHGKNGYCYEITLTGGAVYYVILKDPKGKAGK